MTTAIDYTQLAAALAAQMATGYKTPTGSPSSIYAHGPGGLLSPLGMSRGIANAMVLPGLGLMGRLPRRFNNTENPLHGIFTGVTDTTGEEPDNRCDDPPTAGVSKLCTHTFVWGWIGRKSRELRLDRIGKIINRGEFTDFTLVGNPFAAPDVPAGIAPGGGTITGDMINTEMGKLLFELAVAFLRDQAKDIYTGNPANNVGGNEGGRTYFYGLDTLINTGYQDAITGQACPAADSIVRDWNNGLASDGGIVREITYIIRNLKYIASRAGFNSLQLALSMRWGLFYELTEVWPCEYNTYRCQTIPTGNINNLEATALNTMRDQMRGDMLSRTGQYLLVDGERIPVIIDDAIAEDSPNPAGTFSSDIYFVPLSVNGDRSTPVSEGGGLATYMEDYAFNGTNGPMAAAQQLAPAGTYEVGAGGRYLFHRYFPKNLCVQIAGWTQSRLILETPYLAARLTNVAYQPLMHERDAFTDGAYFVNGGRTDYLGYGPSYFPPIGS